MFEHGCKFLYLFRFVLDYRRLASRWVAYTGAILLLGGPVGPAAAGDEIRDLSNGRKWAIISFSTGLGIAGRMATRLDGDTLSQCDYRANAFDRGMRRRLRGQGDRSTNLLDNDFGSLVTPLAMVCALGLLDIDRHEFSRDVPLFVAGLGATKGLTDIIKSLTSRPRPYMLDTDPGRGPDRDHFRAFFSGHASAAFFSGAFFNKRFRRHMRQNWTTDEYRTWRWVSPAVCFGWASIVGYTRLHADQHYFTDVAAGALAGVLIAELYYRWGYRSGSATEINGATERAFMITLRFPLR